MHQEARHVSELAAGKQREKNLANQIQSLSRQLAQEKALGPLHVRLMSDLREKHAVTIRGLQTKIDELNELAAGCHATVVLNVSLNVKQLL